jgi:hypothetical protein
LKKNEFDLRGQNRLLDERDDVSGDALTLKNLSGFPVIARKCSSRGVYLIFLGCDRGEEGEERSAGFFTAI